MRVERDEREHDLGLVGEKELQHLVPGQMAGGGDHARDEDVLELVARLEGRHLDPEEADDLRLHGGREEAVLATGEHPVDGGPAATRLPGHVVEGGLRHAPAAHAREGGVDEPGFLRGEGKLDRRHSLRH